MVNKFKLLYVSLFTLIICGAFALEIYIIYVTNDKLSIVLGFVFFNLINALFGIYIMSSHRHINTKACWIVALLYLPLIGCVLFLIFGTKTYSDKKLHEINEINKSFSKYEDYTFTKKYIENDPTNIFAYGYNVGLKPVYENNDFELIANNQEYFEKIIESIRLAKSFIHIQTYILHDGFFLRSVFSELVEKAKQGVKIRLLYDWFGSWKKIKTKTLKQLKKNGIEVGIFNPKGINMYKGLTNFRSHRKFIIIDNQIAITGGSNIGDEYLNMRRNIFFWRDLNFVVKGEIVNSFNVSFCNDWLNFTDYSIKKNKKNELKRSLAKILVLKPYKNNNVKIQLNSNTPYDAERSIYDILIKLIGVVKHNIKIVTPYFIPPSDLMHSILCAAKSGVNIEIMLPGKPDERNFIITLNRNTYKNLLDYKCNVYEYNGFIHSKYIIIDDRYVFTGSNNLDFRSLLINFESALLIEDKKLANKFNEIFEYDKKNSKKIELNEIKKITNSFRHKFKMFFLNFGKPIL